MSEYKEWSLEEERKLYRLRQINPHWAWEKFSPFFQNRTRDAIRMKYYAIQSTGIPYLDLSPYPVYDSPLVMEGDALVLPDPEIPFHHAPFINRCLALAEAWGIRQCIIAGDAVHFNSLSSWEANWVDDRVQGGLTEMHERALLDLATRLPDKYKNELYDTLEEIGEAHQVTASDAGAELRSARKTLNRLGRHFERVDFVIGNHDGRLLRALNSPLFVEDLHQFLGLDPVFRIAPYYYSLLKSNGATYRITHPKNSAKYSAGQLADKYQMHILMAHSHKYSMIPSKSGEFMGWQIGCCVDERRLPYAAQRDNTADAHRLGAAIVRNGYAWLLSEGWTDWDGLTRMA